MKILKSALIFFLFFSFFALPATKKVLMVIAFDKFRDEEYSEPRKIIEENGYKVVVASWKKGIATGMLGKKVKVDITLKDIKVDDYDGVIFPGGIGASRYFENKIVWRIIQEFHNKKKVVGALCLSPVILANAGILKGKKATCWFSVARMIKKKGAIYTGKKVEIDGLIITGNGPSAAKEFGEKYLKLLSYK
ncbi:MAG: DJ-1 family protein [Candidatus Omnitrophota bacterium]|nr:MAG: DJ-1 family protein [Candidatus Omnitrophota bacterium]